MKRALGVFAVVMMAGGIAEAKPMRLVQNQRGAYGEGDNYVTIKIQGDRAASRQVAGRIARAATVQGATSVQVGHRNFITGTTTIRASGIILEQGADAVRNFATKAVTNAKAPQPKKVAPLHVSGSIG